MIKRNKGFIYTKHLILMSRTNKVRIVLTSIGIFVAVIIFALGIIITHSYYSKKLSVIDEIQKNTIAIKYDSTSIDQITELMNLIGAIPMDDVILLETKSIFSKEISGQKYLNIMATIHGVNNLYIASPLTSYEDNIYIAAPAILKEGRLLTNADTQNKNHVIVIDEITAQLLFPGEEALGKIITIGAGVNGSAVSEDNQHEQEMLKLEVVGIVESNSIIQEKYLVLKKTLEQTKDNLFFATQVYCPISVVNECLENNETINHMIFAFEDQEEYKDAVSVLEAFVQSDRNSVLKISYTTYENQKKILEEDLQNTRIALNVITIFLCIISGISIMSITFFSIKERVPEIGVRKAFGATKIDIVFQFVFEMIWISFISSIVATCVSVILSKAISTYFYEELYIIFPISIEVKHLVLPILVGVLEAVLCSIAPSLYAARIKVTEALRFE